MRKGKKNHLKSLSGRGELRDWETERLRDKETKHTGFEETCFVYLCAILSVPLWLMDFDFGSLHTSHT